ncbi:hypothetical protein KR093_004564, partial [Drosophila rubida]
ANCHLCPIGDTLSATTATPVLPRPAPVTPPAGSEKAIQKTGQPQIVCLESAVGGRQSAVGSRQSSCFHSCMCHPSALSLGNKMNYMLLQAAASLDADDDDEDD